MSNIVIDLAAEFTGKKAFKQAQNSTTSLTKAVNVLAKKFTAAYIAQKALAYGGASVKAFVADENAARSLGVTLKNLGLETGNTSIYVNDLITRLEAQSGVLDDMLRPAMDRLLRATGSVSKATNLLALALDISAGTGKDLTAVSQALQKAYLGNNASLSKLGVGLSKVELTSSSFEQIQTRLTTLFAGQASSAAESYAGQLNKLAIASNNVKESIGRGLIDSLMILGKDSNASELAKQLEAVGTAIGDILRGITLVIDKFNSIPGAGVVKNILGALNPLAPFQLLGAQARRKADVAKGKNPIQSGSYLAAQTKVTKLTKEQSAAQAKILADKRLTLAVDKANLALGKGGNIFDMDAIQLNAAMINQAEQLGKATSQAQLLMITNDITRLKIKQDIASLEAAIASQDAAAIEAATKKLNEDLKILGTLQNQSLKLADIKTILDALLPKDLINLANLTEAIRLLTIINNGKTPSTVNPVNPTNPLVPNTPNPLIPLIPAVGIPGVNYNPGQNPDRNISNGFPNGVTSGAGLTYNPTQQGDRNYDIKIYANTVANPDELSGLIQDVVIRLNKQGDYLTTAGAL